MTTFRPVHIISRMDMRIQRGYRFQAKWLAGDEPEATIILVNDGMNRSFALTKEAQHWMLTLPSVQTEDMAEGVGRYEVYGHGYATPTDKTPLATGTLEVVGSVVSDGENAAGKSYNERLLDNAREVLMVASDGADLSISVDGYSYSFETRSDLLGFITQLERRVNQERNLRSTGGRDRGILKMFPGARGGSYW